MTRYMTSLLGAAAGAMLLAGPASGQDAYEDNTPIVIDQIQTGDLWSNMNVHVGTDADHAASSATTTGNSANGLVTDQNLDYDAVQQMDGHATAEASLTGGLVTGTATVTSTAYGNASNAGAWNGDSFAQSHQVMNGDTYASSTLDIVGAGTVGVATTAVANVAATAGEFGENRAFQTQASNGSVSAETDADLCCDGESASFATTAAGNTISSTGYTTTAIQGAVQTTASGTTIRGLTDLYMGEAVNTVAVTTASGNSYVLHNEFGYTSLGREGSELFQGNESEIDAQTYVTLDSFSGYAAASAYGVGNSAVVTNSGSDTALHTIQSNFATVGAQASFNGASMSGGVASLSATAIGNTASATLCNFCGDAALSGRTQQFNSASVYAIGSATLPQGGTIIGTATAIGNSATYQSGGH